MDSNLEQEQGALAVLDRLTALQQIIPTELVLQALKLNGLVGQRACLLNHEVMFWIVLAMGILTEMSIQQVYKASRFLRLFEKTPGRSALCQGRARLGHAPVKALFLALVRPLATPTTPGGFYKNWRRVGIDGTCLDLPDSEANALHFGYPQGGRGKGAYPQVRKVALVELGTHVEFAVAFGPLSQGEQTLAADLWSQLPPRTLLYQDKNFFSFHAWKTLRKQGVHILARVKRHQVFPVVRELSDGSFLSKIFKNDYNRRNDRGGIVVRVIRYTLDDEKRTGHGEEHLLVTSLLSARTAPAEELVAEYHERWEQELMIDESKTHQNPKRAHKPAHMRSESPEGVLQELHALSIGHYVVRAMMFEAARERGIDPDRLSFTGTLQILKTRLPECALGEKGGCTLWWQAVIWEIGEQVNPPRQNRINPRVIKQKVKKWRKKQPEDRGKPSIVQPFRETIVIVD